MVCNSYYWEREKQPHSREPAWHSKIGSCWTYTMSQNILRKATLWLTWIRTRSCHNSIGTQNGNIFQATKMTKYPPSWLIYEWLLLLYQSQLVPCFVPLPSRFFKIADRSIAPASCHYPIQSKTLLWILRKVTYHKSKSYNQSFVTITEMPHSAPMVCASSVQWASNKPNLSHYRCAPVGGRRSLAGGHRHWLSLL